MTMAKAGNNISKGLNPPKIFRMSNTPPTRSKIIALFFWNLEFTPMTRPMMISIIGKLNNQLGNKNPKSRFRSNRNTPNRMMIVPTVVDDLLLLGGIGVSCLLFVFFSITKILYLKIKTLKHQQYIELGVYNSFFGKWAYLVGENLRLKYGIKFHVYKK